MIFPGIVIATTHGRYCTEKIATRVIDFSNCSSEYTALFTFTYKYENRTLFAALNFGSDNLDNIIPNDSSSFKLEFGNFPKKEVETSSKTLKPREGKIYIV